MAKYLVLVYEAEPGSDVARNSEYDEHRTFIADHRAEIVAGEGLQSTATATTVRRDETGEQVVTDGPFVDTSEAVCGFYLLDAPDLDAVIDLAKQIPAPAGGVEIRPVLGFG
jgi:hypothetical protein